MTPGYGLNASVWGSVPRAQRIARAIEAGSVNVNEGFTASWASTDAPMGGFKESGVGRRHGREGIIKYTNIQTVATQRGMNVAPPPGDESRKVFFPSHSGPQTHEIPPRTKVTIMTTPFTFPGTTVLITGAVAVLAP